MEIDGYVNLDAVAERILNNEKWYSYLCIGYSSDWVRNIFFNVEMSSQFVLFIPFSLQFQAVQHICQWFHIILTVE